MAGPNVKKRTAKKTASSSQSRPNADEQNQKQNHNETQNNEENRNADSNAEGTVSSTTGTPSTDPNEAQTKPSDASSGPKEGSPNLSGGNADSGKPEHPVRTPDELDGHDESYEGYEGPAKIVERDFIYTTHADPMRRLPGTSPYLDDVERQNAEVHRAKAEGREPDLVNPPAHTGTVLMEKEQFAKTVPGDVKLATDVTLPVVVGTRDEDDDSKKDYHQ